MKNNLIFTVLGKYIYNHFDIVNMLKNYLKNLLNNPNYLIQ